MRSDATFEITLARHGETEWSQLHKHTGRTDVPLTAEGERQAAALRPVFAERTFDMVLVSPLQRAWRTYELSGTQPRAEAVDDLMEWDYGDIEGRRTADIRKEIPGWLIWSHGPPGGETPQQLSARIDRVIARLMYRNGEVAIFAHGHLLRGLAARWLNLPILEGRSFALDTATVSVLSCYRGERVIKRWNDDSHLR